MKPAPLRRLSLAAALAGAALAVAAPALADPGGKGHGKAKGNPHSQTPPPAPSAPIAAVQGVVQAVWPTGALVRLLDGRTVSVSLGRGTLVIVDGHPSRLAAVKPGYVLVAISRSGRATVLRFVKPG